MAISSGLYKIERSEQWSYGFGIYSTVSESFKASGCPLMVPTEIAELSTKALKYPIFVVLSIDEGEVIAITPELPLYGSGDSPQEALDMLKREIESLYFDLTSDDNFTDDWDKMKRYLMNIVVES